MTEQLASTPGPGRVVDFDRSQIEGSVAARFERQMETLADCEALRSGGWSLTYGALNNRANVLAHELLAITGGGEALVALVFDDDRLTVVATIATLKAGAGYMVIDPAQPEARLRAIVADAQPAVIVTQTDLSLTMSGLNDRTAVVTFDDLEDATAAENPALPIDPERLAAVYYTSGSTGEPKGIEWDQRFILHMAWAFGDRFRVAPGDRAALFFSLSFAAAGHDLFQALLNGSTLCLFDVKQSGLPALRAWIVEERITVLHPAVALFRRFIASIDTRLNLPDLRVVILGGDALFRDDVDRYLARVDSSAVLVPRLAMSEAAVVARNVISDATDFEGDIVPAGYPIQDREVWAIDPAGHHLEAGEVGELVVATRFAARGYRNRPDLTAQKFRQLADGRQAYATGDLGMVRADGCIERLGRVDRQVKIRGHRVEIEAVEHALRRQPGIKDVAVVARSDAGHDARLAAHVVLRNQDRWTASEVRKATLKQLPDYMVPATFTVLPNLPELENGKVDYGSLQAKSTPEVIRSHDFVAPRNTTERLLTGIWEQALATSGVGINDDFFDLAGDSLVALQIFAEIENTLGVRLPVTVLLEAPTIRDLALRVDAQSETRLPESIVPLQPLGSKPVFFCAPPAGRTVMILKDLARSLGSDQPFYGLQPPGMDGTSAPLQSVEVMAARYLQDLRSVQPEGPYFLGGMCFGATVAYEMACQLQQRGESVALLAMLDARRAPRADYPIDQGTPLRHLPSGLQRVVQRLGKVWSVAALVARLTRRGDFFATVHRHLRLIFSQLVTRLSRRREDIQAGARQVWNLQEQAQARYNPGSYAGRLDLYWTEDNSPRGRAELEAWQQLVDEPPTVHLIPGSHAFVDSFIKEPHVGALAELLSVSLDMSR